MRSSNGTPLSSALIPVSASHSIMSCPYSCSISAPEQNRQTILVPFSVAGTVFASGAVAARGAAGSVDVSRRVVDVGAAVGTAVQATKIPRAEEAEVVIANLSNERRENVAIAVLLTPRTGAQTARDQRSVRSGRSPRVGSWRSDLVLGRFRPNRMRQFVAAQPRRRSAGAGAAQCHHGLQAGHRRQSGLRLQSRGPARAACLRR